MRGRGMGVEKEESGWGMFGFEARAQIADGVAEATVRFVGGVVGIEVLVYVTVGEVFRAHVVEVVGCLERSPERGERGIRHLLHEGLQSEERVQRGALNEVL